MSHQYDWFHNDNVYSVCRSAASFQRASESTGCLANSETNNGSSDLKLEDKHLDKRDQRPDFRFPFGDWFRHLWPKQDCEAQGSSYIECTKRNLQLNPFLPKVTMVGISTGEAGQMTKANLKKTMENLTKELEQTDQENAYSSGSNEYIIEDRDPLFVANVGGYYSGLAKTGSARWVRGRSNN